MRPVGVLMSIGCSGWFLGGAVRLVRCSYPNGVWLSRYPRGVLLVNRWCLVVCQLSRWCFGVVSLMVWCPGGPFVPVVAGVPLVSSNHERCVNRTRRVTPCDEPMQEGLWELQSSTHIGVCRWVNIKGHKGHHSVFGGPSVCFQTHQNANP